MYFKIEKKLLETNSGLYTGVLFVENVNNKDINEDICELLESEVAKTANELENISVKDLRELDIYRDAFRFYNINPSKYPCSIEAILSRISKKGSFPSICPIVDLCNYISIKYKLPIGIHDINSMTDDLIVRLANDSDCLIEENNIGNDVLKLGEPIYVCGNIVRTRRWMWRQMPAGRVNENSSNFIIPIDGFIENKEIVNEAVKELSTLIHKFFNVKAVTEFIDKEHSEIKFGKLSEEELDIENQIAIMLKGVEQHTAVSDIREKLMSAKKDNRALRIKLGLDPSAPDIHLGHSVVLRKIRQLQELGHKAVIIIGDYTGMIGDPTGKSKTRKQLSREDVERNANTYMEQIFKIIDKEKTEVYYNSEWLSKMNFGDVIELSAKCTVARMLERDDFNNRYTNHLPLSVHEFFYPLMQAYDSVAVRADIELGGTDQTFNILMGRNIQKDYGQEPQLTLFMPLLEGIDGIEKMSKSLGNYIGINESADVIFEKVMKIPDTLIIKYYNLCTDVHPSEINRLKEEMDSGRNPRDVKMLLAHEITKLYSGEQAALDAENHFKKIYQKNEMPDDAPVINVKSNVDIADGEQIITELVKNGFYKSKSEVRRIFEQGGAQLDGEKIFDTKIISIINNSAELKIGKAKYFKIMRI